MFKNAIIVLICHSDKLHDLNIIFMLFTFFLIWKPVLPYPYRVPLSLSSIAIISSHILLLLPSGFFPLGSSPFIRHPEVQIMKSIFSGE